jgi:hypothetical protein
MIRDVLAFCPTGQDTILDQAADLKLSDNQQRDHDNQKGPGETRKTSRTPVVNAVVVCADQPARSRTLLHIPADELVVRV